MAEDNLVQWTPAHMLEIILSEPDDFLKVKETLTRIGVASRKDNKLFQQSDLDRRNTIAQLLADWGLVDISAPSQLETFAPLRQIKIISFKEKDQWELCPKYNIGNK